MTPITIPSVPAHTALKPQQEPASESSSASVRGRSHSVFPEIPAGYVVRSHHGVTARPIRKIGPRDEEILTLAIQSLGFLLPRNSLQTLAGFASLIELRTAHPAARAVADTLHRLSA